MFTNTINSSRQGDIGEARAIYEYTKMGFVVSRTLFDSSKYDLIIDDECGSLKRVQVKTTDFKKNSKSWLVSICTSGGNKSCNIKRLRQDDDYDILFVLNGEGRCWSIPMSEISSGHSITVGNKKYNEYELIN